MAWPSILKTYVLFCALWGVDFALKIWFKDHLNAMNFGAFHFSYVENHGVFLGGFSSLPLILKTVFLSTVGIALVAGLPLAMAIYRFRSKLTLFGSAIVLSGILGNVTDRVIYGFVIDYFSVKTSLFTSPVINFADIVQCAGYCFFFAGLKKEISYRMPENEKRQGSWVSRNYQWKFCLSLLTIYLALGFTFMAFGFTFMKFGLTELQVSEDEIGRYLKFYGMTSVVLLSFSSLVVLYVGKIISHRIAGPAFAIKRYVRDTLMGKHYPLKLRENDHLMELEGPLSELNERFTNALDEVQEIPEIPEEVKKTA